MYTHILDGELVQILSELNVVEVQIGIETINDRVRRMIGKMPTREDIINGAKLLRDSGINLHAGIIYGLPGETNETAEETFQFAQELSNMFPNFTTTASIPVVFPGSALYNLIRSTPNLKDQYPGDLLRDDRFDFNRLTKILLSNNPCVDYDIMVGYALKTQALAAKGRGTGFWIND